MRHIKNCLNPQLAKICIDAIAIESLNDKIIKYLTSPLNENVKVASFQNGTLVLNTNDSVWASQLRFLLPELRENLRKKESLYQLVSIKIKISHHEYKTNDKKKTLANAASDKCTNSYLKETLAYLKEGK